MTAESYLAEHIIRGAICTGAPGAAASSYHATVSAARWLLGLCGEKMPFVALDKNTGQRIDILKIENPKSVLKSGEVICQLCGAPMFIKAGMIIRAHFAHYAECHSDYERHPETPDHLMAKEKLLTKLRNEFSEYSNAQIDLEVKIPEAKRVADILATFPMGWRVAHEIQLSGITIGDLKRRTEAYHNAGIDVVWWLGKSANTDSNREWCIDHFGYALTLHDSRDTKDI